MSTRGKFSRHQWQPPESIEIACNMWGNLMVAEGDAHHAVTYIRKDALVQALKELVICKNLKELAEKTPNLSERAVVLSEYEARKHDAWKKARELVDLLA